MLYGLKVPDLCGLVVCRTHCERRTHRTLHQHHVLCVFDSWWPWGMQRVSHTLIMPLPHAPKVFLWLDFRRGCFLLLIEGPHPRPPEAPGQCLEGGGGGASGHDPPAAQITPSPPMPGVVLFPQALKPWICSPSFQLEYEGGLFAAHEQSTSWGCAPPSLNPSNSTGTYAMQPSQV